MRDPLAEKISYAEDQIIERALCGIKQELALAGLHLSKADLDKIGDLLHGRMLLNVMVS